MSAGMGSRHEITTAEHLLHAGDIGPCELVRGVLRRLNYHGFQHGQVVVSLATALSQCVSEARLGSVVMAPTGYVLERDPDTVRSADVGFIRRHRIKDDLAFVEGAPDLAVEVLSPEDRAGDMMAKTQQWLRTGCASVWIVDPDSRTVTIHRPDGKAKVLGQNDELTGGDIVPGFRMLVAEIFTPFAGEPDTA